MNESQQQTGYSCPLPTAAEKRRGFITTALMLVGVVLGYGMGAFNFFRYLVPLGRGKREREMFAGTLSDFPVGTAKSIKDPRGEDITLARVADNKENPAAGFKALSSKCPHLGCRVHWEAANERFYCPCHNGTFDKNGVATGGPPAKEGKNLSTFNVKVIPETGWVYVMVREQKSYGA